GGLPRARRAHDRHELPRSDVDREARQRVGLHVLGAVDLGDVLYLDHRAVSFRRGIDAHRCNRTFLAPSNADGSERTISSPTSSPLLISISEMLTLPTS